MSSFHCGPNRKFFGFVNKVAVAAILTVSPQVALSVTLCKRKTFRGYIKLKISLYAGSFDNLYSRLTHSSERRVKQEVLACQMVPKPARKHC